MWRNKQTNATIADNSLLRPRGVPHCLQGLTIVRTGELKALTDKQFITYVQTNGGKATSAVSGKTSYLVLGQDPGEVKKRTARDKNVSMITEDQFFQLVRNLSYQLSKQVCQEVDYEQSLIQNYKQITCENIIKQEQCLTDEVLIRDPTLWTIKYQPKCFEDIIGNNSIIAQIKHSLDSDNNLFLITGPPGTGKSSILNILSQDKRFNFVYSNSDESRTGKSIKLLVQKYSHSAVTKQRQVFIFDDAESIEAYGIPEIIKQSQLHTVLKFYLVSQDSGNQKFKTLKTYSQLFQLKRPQKQQISKLLSTIMTAEAIKGNISAIADICGENASGDIRRCLNVLQFSSAGKQILQPSDVKLQLSPQTSLLEKTDIFFNAKKSRNQSQDFYADIQSFYYREQLFYPSLVQNYQTMIDFDFEFAIFMSNQLSQIDQIVYRQFHLSDWSASRAATCLIQQAALELINQNAKSTKFVFPQFPGIISLDKASREVNLLFAKFTKFNLSGLDIDLGTNLIISQVNNNDFLNFMGDFDVFEMENMGQKSLFKDLKTGQIRQICQICSFVQKNDILKQKKLR
ncbi:Replication factor C, subunit 1 [Spironucleus salmonicida]|uniref:Replication factor C, subunit 1 n=1 Tax=Spironucleus salmonicida TaxID=348837 RepID=V6LDC6_9EUKA|nr:Replication factor C, subunit 1 [Spironucleus salmonicida]|eukprot:EST42243.1 Replication factor C, subunit 1 [Spironucleus salmonicida]